MSSDTLLNFGPPFSGARDGVRFSGSCQQAGFQPVFFSSCPLQPPREASSRTLKITGFFPPPKLLRSWNFHWAEGLNWASVESSQDCRPADLCLLWHCCGPSLLPDIRVGVSRVPCGHRSRASPSILPQPVPSRLPQGVLAPDSLCCIFPDQFLGHLQASRPPGPRQQQVSWAPAWRRDAPIPALLWPHTAGCGAPLLCLHSQAILVPKSQFPLRTVRAFLGTFEISSAK